MNSLMAEVVEDHIRAHAFRREKPQSDEAQAAEDLVDVVRTYLK
jgi:DNA-binding FrmR family transcriptional regulator